MYRVSSDHSDAFGEKPYLVGQPTRRSRVKQRIETKKIEMPKKVTNVLIVDDDISFGDLLSDFLVESGEFNVVARCGSYMEAKQFCLHESNMKAVDAIILDVMLPYSPDTPPESKMGLVVLEKLREHLHFQGPVIVLTSSIDSDDGREALAKGCSGYLCKHASPESVPRMVSELKLALSGDIVLIPSKLRHLIVDKNESMSENSVHVMSALGHNPAWTDIKKELGFDSMRREPSHSTNAVRKTGEWTLNNAQGGGTGDAGLGASATLVKHVMDSAPRPIFITTTDGVIEFVNLEAENVFGFEQVSLLGRRIQDVFPTVNLTALVRGTEFECYVRGGNGVHMPVSVATSAIEELEESHLIHIFTDLTSQKSTEQRLKAMLFELEKSSNRLEELVKSDPLTGLLNRRGLEAVLSREVSLARRNNTEVIAVLVDLDNFKGVNDVYGHAGGDAVLRAVADAMRETLRTSDWVGRIGGDEFLVFLPATTLENGIHAAERIRAAVAGKSVPKDGGYIRATTSLGVARLPLEVSSLEHVLELTKSGLKSSKHKGKNSVSVSTDSFSQASLMEGRPHHPKMRWFSEFASTFKTWFRKPT